MKEKRLLALFLVLAIMFSFAGCSSGDKGGQVVSEAPAASGANAPAEPAQISDAKKTAQEAAEAYKNDPDAKVLHVGTTVSGGGFHFTERADTLANYLIFESLVRMDNGVCYPLLAESITWVDNLTCEVKVNEKATFNNGEPVLGEDVLYAFQMSAVGMMASNFSSIDLENSYVKDDGMTVVFKLNYEYGPFEEYALEMPSIVDKSACEDWEVSDPRWWDQPITTGPYLIAENVSGSHLTLVKRDDYWNKDNMPEWDMIVIHYFSDQTAMFVAFENGELDIVMNMASTDYDRMAAGDVKNADTVAYGTVGYKSNYCLYMNPYRQEFSDPKVREAIAYAIDREAVGTICFGGLYKLPTSVLSDSTRYYKKTGAYDYDIEYAKQCMAESSYSKGFSVEAVCVTGEDIMWEVIQGSLSQIGIDVKISSYDMMTAIGMLLGGAGDVMLFCPGGGNKFCEPYVELSSAYDESGLPVTRIMDEQFNEWFDAALFTTDTAQREENYAKMQQWLHDNFQYIPVVEPTYSYAYRTDKISSVEIDSVGNPNLNNIHPR
ncbi:MAG: ABC transporter substrate-binding protein [Oscillospiraceae bacterium]|jgi:peptide/nickel transport system substrate-binding protein